MNSPKIEALERDRILSEITGCELCYENKKINEVFDGMIMETHDEHPDSIFFIKIINGKKLYYMERDTDQITLWYHYERIQNPLSELNLTFSELSMIVKIAIERIFDVKTLVVHSGELLAHKLYNSHERLY